MTSEARESNLSARSAFRACVLASCEITSRGEEVNGVGIPNPLSNEILYSDSCFSAVLRCSKILLLNKTEYHRYPVPILSGIAAKNIRNARRPVGYVTTTASNLSR